MKIASHGKAEHEYAYLPLLFWADHNGESVCFLDLSFKGWDVGG
jgi:hypothetical protein